MYCKLYILRTLNIHCAHDSYVMAGSHIRITDYQRQIPGELIDKKTWRFPVIESINTHGRRIMWVIYVRLFRMRLGIVLPAVPDDAFVDIEDYYFSSRPLDADMFAWIKVDSGLVGGGAKKSVPTIVKAGKNIGRASATNVWTQALRDALGKYNKQFKKSTSESTNTVTNTTVALYPPMLAQILLAQKTPLDVDNEHPVYVQRKYNGVRTISVLDGEAVIMYSRRRNLYPGFGYIKAELRDPLAALRSQGRVVYLDGEMYKHGVSLQEISGYARREDQLDDVKYDYMIYDCFVPDEPDLLFCERKCILDTMFAAAFTYCKEVETFTVHSMQEIQGLYEKFVAEGFEGAMVRLDAAYKYSYNEHHSKVLLKMKPVLDAEFEVVGWTTGEKGKSAEALMIICRTAEGIIFPVTPALELTERVALVKQMGAVEPNGKTHFENHWLGREIIVSYDELSKDKVPQRARTKMERRVWD